MARASVALGASRAQSPSVAGLPERAVRLLQEIRWIALGALAAYLALILLTYDSGDPSWSHAVQRERVANGGGQFGAWLSDLLLYLFGLCAYLLVALLAVAVIRGARAARNTRPGSAARFAWERWVGFVVMLVGCAMLESSRLHVHGAMLPLDPGGLIGSSLSEWLLVVLGPVGSLLATLVLSAGGFSLWTGWSWLSISERVGYGLEWIALKLVGAYQAAKDRKFGARAATRRDVQVQELRRIFEEDPEPVKIAPPVVKVERSARVEAERQTPLFSELPADTELPPVSLLDPPPVDVEAVDQETLQFTSRLIEKKLADFNVAARVEAAYPGPVITRYEIEPATGVKGSQIVNLSKDLARALSLVSLRVVETIPGKNLMGLELPNARRQTVRLSEILGSKVYADGASPVTLALGKDIAGNVVVADLAKMPHLLVAGTTGSGKSVGINAMILSLLYKSDPTQVRLLMIDPKMLEMSVYEGIPHLLAPVVTDMRQAGNALNWCVAEMERRYRVMSKLGVRNLSGYNHKIADAEKRGESIPNPFSLTPDAPEPLERLPMIVVVIDELADLMMVVGKKIEELIARLAQKARAAGIHLILATQRPSVDVITGLIKANIPTRIAFQVSSKVDSRTILDQMGAESLLGQGDMLYLPPGSGLPVRVHGAFVADEEVHKVVEHWKLIAEPQYVEGLLEGGMPEEIDAGSAVGFGGLSQTLTEAGVEGESDPLYDQAVAVVLKHRRASISLVQRHLRIGYNRSARLLEQMERSGLVSAMASNGNRDILVPANAEES
ncbi:MAG: DNA translocase FtsK 4TM domain-containing protein [Burkholderiaceae bacterium]|nr:DNA translocase FtsK 4TM domain-containing protein [Burkholderiaceae bacterium]